MNHLYAYENMIKTEDPNDAIPLHDACTRDTGLVVSVAISAFPPSRRKRYAAGHADAYPHEQE